MKRSSVVYIIAVLFIGCLLIGGQCRPEPESTNEDGRANATMVVSSSDDNEITMKFCVIRDCKTKGEFLGLKGACFCCLNRSDVPCFHTQDECKKNCPPI
ncbi:hypothetical protein CFC21_013104 [Triticum aestivum]|uniref:Embryo surrounding factor 1 brassicaceae domain-containing protein n=2 Tax=Triticum aestivum TaxID=4565 RepID=A0A9R1DRU6_WHEAT|nr:hypothetical protein CFC21_013104 [Triticum aestivum]